MACKTCFGRENPSLIAMISMKSVPNPEDMNLTSKIR